MENRIARDGETYLEQESDYQEYDSSNIIDLRAEEEDTTKFTPKVSANIYADITPEHIKELSDGLRKSKELETMLEAFNRHLSVDNLTSEDCENIRKHMDNVIIQAYNLKQSQNKSQSIWKIILASGVSLSLCLLGSGYLLKCLKK